VGFVTIELCRDHQGCFAQLDGFNKAGFFGEIPADSLLRKGIRVTASMAGQFCKQLLLLRREMYFHKRSVGAQLLPVNGPKIRVRKIGYILPAPTS